MYIPEAIRQHLSAPGGLWLTGMTILSLVLAGIALHLLGVVGVVVAIFVLVFVEVWREAASLSKKLAKAETDFELASRDAQVVPGLRGQVEELQGSVLSLEEEKREPRAGLEETLEVLTIHLRRLSFVLKHRAMDSQVSAVPIVRAEINEDGAATLAGVAEDGIDLIRGEPLVAVKRNGESGLGLSESAQIDGPQVEARFDLAALPDDLADEIDRRGSLNPQGYTLRLAGLYMDEYKALDDAELNEMQASLKGAVDALARTLVGGVSPDTTNSEGQEP